MAKQRKKSFDHNPDTSNKYFAALDTPDIGTYLMEKIDNYFYHTNATGRLGSWMKNYNMYHGPYFRGSQLIVTGEQGEYVMLGVNHYKNILKHIHNNVTSAKIAFEPHSTNTDTKSQAQTLLARNLLEYYRKEKRMERYVKDADLSCLLYGEGFVIVDWDAMEGEITAYEPDDNGVPDETMPIREGDIMYTSTTPNNVIRDVSVDSWDKVDWVIVREFKNKYVVASRYPDYADEISARSCAKSRFNDTWGDYDYTSNSDGDQIPVYTFYHKKTAAGQPELFESEER